MRRILYDQQIFRKQNYGGISRYFTELIIGINKTSDLKALPENFYSENIYLKENNLTKQSWFKSAKGKAGLILNKLMLKTERQNIFSILSKENFDVFHPTYYDETFLNYIPTSRPFVFTVHDMIHESYYDNMLEYLTEETKHKAALIPRAAHIIAVSNYTKQQVLKFFPEISEDKISVIYHGSSLKVKDDVKKPDGLPDNYLLYVGIKKHYKNFFWMVEAISDYLKQNNLTLICAGGPDFDKYEQDFIIRLGLTDHLQYLPIHTDDDLIAVYKNAGCFVFPSLIEGFGIPILEAFVCECPMVLANSSCFPEIAGDAALYFEPGDREGLVNKIDQLLKDTSTRQQLIIKGVERAKQFSWATSVQQHIKIYKSLVN